MTDDAYAQALSAGLVCTGVLGGQVCYNAPNEGYALCEACFRFPLTLPQTCSVCGNDLIMGQNCSDPMCSTMYLVREGATYEEMIAFDAVDRQQRTENEYKSTKKEELYDVSKYKAEDEAAICVICIEDIEVGDRIARLHCDGEHPFHLKCILSAFKTTGMRCPTCMKDLKANKQ